MEELESKQGGEIMSWKEIKIKDIPEIEKVVAEFEVGEVKKTPWGKFRVRVLERQDGSFIAITNLMFIDHTGCENSGYGEGKTIEEALEKAIKDFMSYLPDDRELTEDDFTVADPYDF